jgi:hypothetical protein
VKLLSLELNNRHIKTLNLIPFTNLKSKESDISKNITEEFKKSFIKQGFSINSDADTIVKGMIMSFKDNPKKYKIEIKVEDKQSIMIT